MKKKTWLIFCITLIALSALLPSAGAVLADGYKYYYAYGWSAKAPGVKGYNHVYDNDVYSYFVAEYVPETVHRWRAPKCFCQNSLSGVR
jgi:hypothetical protein